MAHITHKQFIEDEVFHLLAQGLKKIHNKVIEEYLPEDIKSGSPDYQLWNDNVNIDILDELVKQIHIINQEERDY